MVSSLYPFSLADRLLSPFPFLPFISSVSWPGKEDPPLHHARRSLSPVLQPSLAQVSAFKMILFFISRFLCITPPRLLPPFFPRRPRGEKIKRGTNTIFNPSFRGERAPQSALNHRNIPVFSGTPTCFSLAIISFYHFFLDASDKKGWWWWA